MRITIKPPSPTPPALAPGALLAVRVETSDPAPLLAGPPSIAYEGRYTADPAPGAFLFPAPADGTPGVSTAAPAASDFRTPPAPALLPRVDVDAAPGDTITATLALDNKTYSAALRAPGDNNPHQPVEMTLVEGGAAPPAPPTPPPSPAPGLTITPDPGDPDVLNLDPAPGNDNIVVEN